jgi:hypothetical protein
MTSPSNQEQQGSPPPPEQTGYPGQSQVPGPWGPPVQQGPYPVPGPGVYPPPILPAQRQPFEPQTPPATAKRGGAWKVVLGTFLGLVVGIGIGAAGSGGTSTGSAAGPAPVSTPPAQQGPAQATPAPDQQTGPVAPTWALTSLGPGTYQVGTGAGDATPGQYRSSGPDGSNPAGCYYERTQHNDGSVGDILSNDVSQGPTVFTLKPSDGFVQIQGCTFTHS